MVLAQNATYASPTSQRTLSELSFLGGPETRATREPSRKYGDISNIKSINGQAPHLVFKQAAMEAVAEPLRGSKRKAEDSISLAPKRIKVEADN